MTKDEEEEGFVGAYSTKAFNNSEDAKKRLLMAAEKGDTKAQFTLGSRNQQGHYGPPHPQNFVAWYSKSAAGGYPHGYWMLGICHEFGLGVPIDYDKAERCYLQAIKQGHKPSVMALDRVLARNPSSTLRIPQD